jgi:hypothetical protein
MRHMLPLTITLVAQRNPMRNAISAMQKFARIRKLSMFCRWFSVLISASFVCLLATHCLSQNVSSEWEGYLSRNGKHYAWHYGLLDNGTVVAYGATALCGPSNSQYPTLTGAWTRSRNDVRIVFEMGDGSLHVLEGTIDGDHMSGKFQDGHKWQRHWNYSVDLTRVRCNLTYTVNAGGSLPAPGVLDAVAAALAATQQAQAPAKQGAATYTCIGLKGLGSYGAKRPCTYPDYLREKQFNATH